jgi:hypothetical protein
MRISHSQRRRVGGAFVLESLIDKTQGAFVVTALEDGKEEYGDAEEGGDCYGDVDDPPLPSQDREP